MESSYMVERALKSSFRSKTEEGQDMTVEDCLLGLSGASSIACNDDFVVDDLFDFSNEDGQVEEEEEEERGEEEEEEEEEGGREGEGGEDEDEDDDGGEEGKDSLSDVSQEGDDDCFNLRSSSSASGEPILTRELTVPYDDAAELEWLSQFVEDDSPPEFPTCYLTGKWKQESSAGNRSEPEPRPVFISPPCFPSHVPVKTRTKRARPVKLDRPPSAESSSTSSCSSENSSSSCLSFTSVLTGMEVVRSQSEPEKKKKKIKKTRGGPPVQSGQLQFQRRCSHCLVQKTPQWRAGPLGPKTLCNACGVRYKSGRLFPEYRPACSPTFSVEAHSNSHRKVLEMRKRKEVGGRGMEGGELKLNRVS